MKYSKSAIHRKFHSLPDLAFEDHRLTSFSGLIVFQALFARLDLKSTLNRCFRHLKVSPIFGHGVVVMVMVVHLLLGYRRLRDLRYYQDDPLVRRVLGLTRLPDVATLSRTLAGMDHHSADQMRAMIRRMVGDRLVRSGLKRVTVDFDGSVLSTGRFAEGTAVGFNRKKKGQRSYYPLFCTIAQTGQVFDLWHRSGNVHDSNGAANFMRACLRELRQRLGSGVVLEVRADSAFFSDEIVTLLGEAGVEFALSVPFERFAELKQLIENRKRWRRINGQYSFFEHWWAPKSWGYRYRFVFVRTRSVQRNRGPVQLDLFQPTDTCYDYQVVISNKTLSAGKVARFYHGRGAQEGLFAELKSQIQMDYVPTRREAGNRVYVLSAVLAHNLNRELQMIVHQPARKTNEKRSPLWSFERLDTLRRTIIQRAGRLTHPGGKLKLTMSANQTTQDELLHILTALERAA